MISLVFATNNAHKVEEIQAAVGSKITVISLEKAGINIEIPEPHPTLEQNATEKSATIHQLTGQNCFSEDTGLEIEELNGEPGVKSARYAGDDRSFDKNIDKVLNKLQGKGNRRARFRTIISLIWDSKEYQFEGICEGTITEERSGAGGFGYDPVFLPSGSNRTFAQMSIDEKNEFSHRRKAADQLIAFLKTK